MYEKQAPFILTYLNLTVNRHLLWFVPVYGISLNIGEHVDLLVVLKEMLDIDAPTNSKL